MRLGIMTSIMLWLCMFSLCSCVSSGPIESDYNSESETMQTPNSMFFDWELTNKPTDSQMKKVRKGMSYYEVVEIIGKPHSFADNIDNSQTFKWITQEGNVFFCFFILDTDIDIPNVSIEEYNRYTVAYSEPGMVGINLSAGYVSTRETSFVIEGVSYYGVVDKKGERLGDFYIKEPASVVDQTTTVYRITDGMVVFDATALCNPGI